MLNKHKINFDCKWTYVKKPDNYLEKSMMIFWIQTYTAIKFSKLVPEYSKWQIIGKRIMSFMEIANRF